ncbi:MAG: hypothetical protein KIT73_13435 [Burkholderiales bacterium]|nr:hypothetical protein [Burkholderiales bacterium]
MNDPVEMLAAMQLGDSFFPSGSASFSWGLETLRADGHVDKAAAVGVFVAGQLEHRWATFDRPAVAAAWRAGADLDAVCAVDRLVDAATLAREAREGGRRIGAALLKVHAGMGTPGAETYRTRIAAGEAFGQMSAVHGLVGAATGLTEATTCALSAYGVAAGLVSAAVRMGLCGHLDGQRILQQQRVAIAGWLTEPCAPLHELQAYAPAAEIAMMRHETGSSRLFAS